MTTKDADTHSSSPATEPLALRLSEGLGAWQPIETAPASGYFMVYEDGAYRLRLRHESKWLDTAYAGIECAPWGDVAVGQDAQRILDMRATAGAYKLVVRDGSCENPTHWMPLPAPPQSA